MRRSTLILLGLTALGLGIYILAVDRYDTSTEQSQHLARRVLPGLERDKIDRIEIERPGGPATVLERADDGWRIVEPVSARADGLAVEAILSGAEFLERIRTVEPSTNQRQLGLVPPSLRITLGHGEIVTRLDLGRVDPSGLGVYSRHGSALFVVERAFFEKLNKTVAQLRERTLLPLSQQRVRKIQIQGPSGSLTVSRGTRGEGRWLLSSGGTMVRARITTIEKLAAALEGLRARRFLERGGSPPPHRVVVALSGGSRVELRIGGDCPGRPGERLVARKEGSWVWACVDAEDLAPVLAATAKTLFELRLTDRRLTDLDLIRIQRPPRPPLVLRRDAGKWTIEGDGDGDQQLIHAWLRRLRSFTGTLEEADPRRPSAFVAATRLTLGIEDQGQEVAHVGSPRNGRVPVRRDQEGVVLWFPQDLVSVLDPDPLRFRSRRVLELSRYHVRRVTTQRGSESEVVALEGGKWRVLRPVKVAASRDHMDRLLSLLSRLEVESFRPVGTSPRAVRQRVEIGLDMRSGRAIKIEVWVTGEGGCTGRVAGAPVFALRAGDCSLLAARRADLALFEIPGGALRRIAISTGGRKLEVARAGAEWKGLPPSRVAELITTVKGLRASRAISYRASGLRPHLELTVTREGDRSQSASFTKKGEVVVRGRPVTYQVSTEVIGRLAGFLGVTER
jgi:hypothetical protein